MRKTFFNYVSFFHVSFTTYRSWFFYTTDYFFRSNAGFNNFSKIYFQKYNLDLYLFASKLLLIRKLRYTFLDFFFVFNPNFFLNFKMPNIRLQHSSTALNFTPNVSNKVYYNFIKFTNADFYFTERFVTINSGIYNKNYFTIKNVLYKNFAPILRTLDFRYIFFSANVFFAGDFFESSDIPMINCAELFSPDFVLDNNAFFPLNDELEVGDVSVFPLEQFDLYVYDDHFDYRVQHRVLERTVDISLFPNSFNSYPRFSMLTSSASLPVLKNFSKPTMSKSAHCINFVYFISEIKNFKNSQKIKNFVKYIRLELIKTILNNIWGFYSANFELFVAANNSLYLLLQKFPAIWSTPTQFFEFIKFFTTTNFTLNFFSKILEKSLDSFITNSANLKILNNFCLITKKELEFFLDKCLFNFSQKLMVVPLEQLVEMNAKITEYSNFITLNLDGAGLIDSAFRTSFLSFLFASTTSLHLDDVPKKIIRYMISDFNSKYSSSVSFAQFITKSKVDGVWNGLDLTFLDNADFIVSEFEFLFRQIAVFDYFSSFEMNLQIFFSGLTELRCFTSSFSFIRAFFISPKVSAFAPSYDFGLNFLGFKFFLFPFVPFLVPQCLFTFKFSVNVYKQLIYLLICNLKGLKKIMSFWVKFVLMFFIFSLFVGPAITFIFFKIFK